MAQERAETDRKVLQWPPRKEDLVELYLEKRLSASKIAKAYGLKYASEMTAESTILYHLKKNGISRRDPAAHIRKVTEEMVDQWVERYENGESLKKIAGEMVDPVTVFNHLRERNLKLRDKVEAQIAAVKKFEKFPFDGRAAERAYLLGLTRGDLGVTRHGRAIRVRTSSTHPAMIDLVLSLFAPYGPTRVYPHHSKKAGYEWTVEAELDSSFEFLLLEKRIPPPNDAPEEIALAYMGGLLDSEGSIWLRRDRSFAPNLSFTNQDTGLLDWIEAQLARLGFNSSRSPPDTKSVSRIFVWRQQDVVELLAILQIKHPEKKAKARLILGQGPDRSNLRTKWEELLNSLEQDRVQFIALSEALLQARKNIGIQ